MPVRLIRNKAFLLVLIGIAYSAILFVSARNQFGGKLSGFLFTSPVGRCPDVYHDGLLIRDDSGYDGQFFYYMAIDPFIHNPQLYRCTGIDAYRYQRVLFPLVSSALSGGKKERLPIVMLAVNLGAILLGAYFLMRICESAGLHPGAALFLAFSPAPLISLTRSTCEPLYIAALIGAFYFYAVKRHLAWTAAALCLSMFAKELALGTAGILLIFEWVRRRNFKESLWLLAPFAFYALWQWRVDLLFAELPVHVTHAQPGAIGSSVVNFFVYFWERLGMIRIAAPHTWADPLLQANLMLCLGLFARAAAKLDSPYPWIGGFFSLLVMGFSFPPNGTDFWGYGRHSAEIFLCAFLLFAAGREKIFRIPLILNAAAFILLAVLVI